jgi:four helix bundle protein
VKSQIQSYKDLIFWQKAYTLSRQVIQLSRKLPRDQVTYVLVKQILRSSTSIGANIAEGYGRYKGKEYARFLQIALGSAQETEYWLMLIGDEYSSCATTCKQLASDTLEIILMLNKTLYTLRSQ